MSTLIELIATDPDLLAAVIFGVSLLGVALAMMLWSGVLQPDERRLHRRIERLRSPAAARQNNASAPMESLKRQRKDSSIASLDRLLKRIMPDVNMLRLRLERSGMPLAVGDYLLICLGLAVTATLATVFLYDLPMILNLCVAIVVGLGLPHFIVGHRMKQRVKKFGALLPDALDLIVRGIRSGLPVAEAINTIGMEVEDPVGIEFRQVSDQMRIGVNMDEALWSAARRLQIPEFNFLVISMAIQQETGGNLAEILEKLADMVRRREQMRLKIKAMSSEARASAMIIGSLPFVMAGVLFVVNPGYIDKLFTDPRGWLMIGGGLASLTVGLGVMAKMVRFEI